MSNNNFTYQTMLTCIGNKRKLITNIEKIVENNIEKTRKNAKKYFRDNNFIMSLDTLISKNNNNSEIFGTTYPEFLKRTIENYKY